MVELLAARYGVDVDSDGKSVWFELWTDVPAEAVRDSQWRFAYSGGNGDDRTVRLINLPIALARAAQRHRDSLLRECTLHTLAHGDLFGVARDSLLQAVAVHDLVTDAMTSHTERAAGADLPADTVTAEFSLPATCAAHIPQLRDVLELANLKAREGVFLTRPALPEIRAYRTWLLDEISHQLTGQPATAWAPPADAEHMPDDGADWDVEEVARTGIAMLAANDDNIIVAANAAAEELLGWSPGDLVGRRIITIIPAHLRERHSIGFTNFLLTGTSRIVGNPVSVSALHRDGTEVPVTLLINVRQTREGRAVFVAELTTERDELR